MVQPASWSQRYGLATSAVTHNNKQSISYALSTSRRPAEQGRHATDVLLCGMSKMAHSGATQHCASGIGSALPYSSNAVRQGITAAWQADDESSTKELSTYKVRFRVSAGVQDAH